ncbi:MAG TPA: lactonase family protein [Candidatus Acidoferrum sp.]|nr:lactonase family protein [Candidatus Acidoferrum sp.]
MRKLWGMLGLHSCAALFILLAAALCARAAGGEKYLIYIGTYTDHGSQGIYAYGFNSDSGGLTSLGLAAATPQPSFLVTTRDHRFLYAINELDKFDGQSAGAVSAFSIDVSSGKLTLLNQVSSRGPGPAFITLDKTQRYILVANYGGGSVAVFARRPDGGIGDLTAFVRHSGSSVNPERQEAPHAHCIAMSPDNRYAAVADLGLDQILVYPFDQKHGALGQARINHTDPGVGPRHLTFSSNGKFLYVINELASTVVVNSFDKHFGSLTPLQSISTLPANFKGTNTDAEIALDPSGKFLYASNRGDDSITVFAVKPRKGTLSVVQTVATGGKTPRNFAIDPTGQWLLAANQNSNTVYTFRIDTRTGRLTASGNPIEVFSPSMVDFVSLQGKK